MATIMARYFHDLDEADWENIVYFEDRLKSWAKSFEQELNRYRVEIEDIKLDCRESVNSSGDRYKISSLNISGEFDILIQVYHPAYKLNSNEANFGDIIIKTTVHNRAGRYKIEQYQNAFIRIMDLIKKQHKETK